MATVAFTTPSDSPFPLHRFTVDEYRRLGEVGVLTPEDRVELLEGVVIEKMNHNPSHSGTVSVIEGFLNPLLPDGWFIRVQDSVTTEDSEPEPDLAIVRGHRRDYLQRHPGPADTALLIEVADSSLERDRYKCQIYARAGFPAYWIVNLVDRKIEVYTDPTGPSANRVYGRHEDCVETASVPVLIEQQEIAQLKVLELLP
ncbi:MAG: hypothetical protein CMJ64_18995 [Planctomycetaceae bacterium]|nr:hypothetical protein [Planctomycetaceae bacterium]